MSKHTPGPWKANLYLGGAYAIDHVAKNGDRLGRVAVVDGLIETKANAILIAAAPDLADVAHMVLTTATVYTPPELVQAATEALRKAGEEV